MNNEKQIIQQRLMKDFNSDNVLIFSITFSNVFVDIHIKSIQYSIRIDVILDIGIMVRVFANRPEDLGSISD